MLKFSGIATVFCVSIAALAGCTTGSKSDYDLARNEIRKNAAVRRELVAQCKADFSKNSATDNENMAAVLGVSTASLPSAFCTRLYGAIASGKLTYEDFQSARRGGYAKLIRVLRS